jgi:hypothetical protein
MSKKRAFVRYTKAGKLVPGSLIITDGTHPNGPATWREITFDKCCDDVVNGCCGPNVILQTNLNWYCENPYVDNIYANSDNAGIDFGVYGEATNYALYINANYNDNSKDESQVVINGDIPYNIGETEYATLTVNGYLYTENIKVSGNVSMDCGVVVFTGVAP